MTISARKPIQLKTEEEFRSLDYRVMGLAFAVHNDLGPHLNEIVYKNELAFRLNQQGISAIREYPIDLAFSTFSKTIFIDLFVDNGAVYEVKTVSCFAPAHRTQAINYLLATGTRHGKLVNFRGPKVDGKFISTSLDHVERCSIQVIDLGWQGDDFMSTHWRETLVSLVRDWGAFLSLSWYREALMHVVGGLSRTETEIALTFQGRPIGTHDVRLLTIDTMWTLSGTKQYAFMKQHLARFLQLTHIARIQWANLHNRKLQFTTLVR